MSQVFKLKASGLKDSNSSKVPKAERPYDIRVSQKTHLGFCHQFTLLGNFCSSLDLVVVLSCVHILKTDPVWGRRGGEIR